MILDERKSALRISKSAYNSKGRYLTNMSLLLDGGGKVGLLLQGRVGFGTRAFE